MGYIVALTPCSVTRDLRLHHPKKQGPNICFVFNESSEIDLAVHLSFTNGGSLRKLRFWSTWHEILLWVSQIAHVLEAMSTLNTRLRKSEKQGRASDWTWPYSPAQFPAMPSNISKCKIFVVVISHSKGTTFLLRLLVSLWFNVTLCQRLTHNVWLITCFSLSSLVNKLPAHQPYWNVYSTNRYIQWWEIMICE